MAASNQVAPPAATSSLWRAPGVWLFLVLTLYLLFSAAQAFFHPQGVADTFGPNASGGTTPYIPRVAQRDVGR